MNADILTNEAEEQTSTRPAISANISPSAFFHAIEQLRPTLLIDEADTNLRGKDDITGILNAGYTKSTAFVWRMSYDAATGAPKKRSKNDGAAPGRVARYSCWCPKAIAGIGRLPATLASRCIVVQMHRKTEREQCERLSRPDGAELKRKCARFVADHQADIASTEPKIPAGLRTGRRTSGNRCWCWRTWPGAAGRSWREKRRWQ